MVNHPDSGNRLIKSGYLFYAVMILSVLLNPGCGPHPGEGAGSKDARISGTISNAGERFVYFNTYRDSVDFFIARMTNTDSAELSPGGSFSIYPDNTGPIVYSLRYGNKELVSNLFLCPGDRVNFQFTGNENKPKVIPSGPASRFTSFLLLFREKFYREHNANQLYYIASNYMSPQEFSDYSNARRDSMHRFYLSFFGADAPRREYASYIKHTIDYEFGSDRLMYLWKKRMKGEPVTIDTTFLAFITGDFIENTEALISPSYIRFINLYIKHQYEQMVEDGLFDGPQVAAAEKYKLAQAIKNPRIRNAVLYNLILNDRNDVSEESAGLPASQNLDSLLSAFRIKYHLE